MLPRVPLSEFFWCLRATRWPLLLYLVLHAALFVYDLHHPEAFLRGDRADSRLQLIEQVRQVGPSGLGALFLSTGLPGDYLIFLPSYELSGQYGVILAQLIAGAVTLLISVWLAGVLGASARMATAAGLVFCLLSGAVMDPHLLVTESFFTAVFAAALLALARAARDASGGGVWLGTGLFALAAFIRPQALPLGLVAALPLFILVPRLRRELVLAPLFWLLVFPGLWLLWRYLQVGEIGLGPSMFDAGINFRIRADRMASIAAIPGWVPMDWSNPGPSRLTLGVFVGLAMQYPRALFSTLVSDLLNFIGNPGANALFGIYLQFYPPSADVFFWKHTFDNGGLPAVLRAVFGGGGRLVFSFALTGVLYGLTLVGALLGAARVSMTRESRPIAVVIAMVCLAESAVVFIAGIVRWTHRAPLEPVIAALAGIGLVWMIDRWRRDASSAGPVVPGGQRRPAIQ